MGGEGEDYGSLSMAVAPVIWKTTSCRQDCGRPFSSQSQTFWDSLLWQEAAVHQNQNLPPHEEFLPFCSGDPEQVSGPPPPLTQALMLTSTLESRYYNIAELGQFYYFFNNLLYFLFFIFYLFCHSCRAFASLFINHPSLMSLFVYIVYIIVTVCCLLS